MEFCETDMAWRTVDRKISTFAHIILSHYNILFMSTAIAFCN